MSRRSLFIDQEEDVRIGRKRSTDPGGDLDITPMIDVTFLLLIFFMVTSTMNAEQNVDIPKAAHGANIEESSAIVILVRSPRTVGGTPVIELNGSEADLEDVAAFVKQEAGKGKTQVIVKAGREVPHGFIQRVFREASSVDGMNFSLGVEDKTGP